MKIRKRKKPSPPVLKKPRNVWLTGIDIAASPYTILIRSPTDPERISRAKSHELYGDIATTRWKRIGKKTADEWLELILDHLGKHGPMTFNALLLGLTARTVTADVAFEMPPYQAVVNGVLKRILQITADAPCLIAPADWGLPHLTESPYLEMVCEVRGVPWSYKHQQTFEKHLEAAAAECFPDARVRGCWVHEGISTRDRIDAEKKAQDDAK